MLIRTCRFILGMSKSIQAYHWDAEKDIVALLVTLATVAVTRLIRLPFVLIPMWSVNGSFNTGS